MNTKIKQQSEVREQRAKSILQKGNPETIDEHTYLVPSQFDKNKKYRVTHFDSYSCECEDFKKNCTDTGLYCKHIKAIILFQKLKDNCEVEDNIKQEITTILDIPENDCCPYCQSQDLIKRGIRITSTEEKQRYSCKDCKKRFVLSPIKNIKVNAKFVCLAMDCYYKGLSYRDISDQFKQFYDLNLHHETIRRWILKFSRIMEKYSETLTPKTSGVWNADETLIRTKKGNREKGADYDYLWNVMDNKTKFLLASVNSEKTRSNDDARKVMQTAIEQNKKNPNTIITDRNPSYNIINAFKGKGHKKIKHISIVGHRKQINNNVVENLHTHQKEFHKVRRGVNEVQKYADGYKIFHNFVKKGVKDKLTPADRSGIEVKGNKWESILINSLKVPKATTKHKNIKSPAF